MSEKNIFVLGGAASGKSAFAESHLISCEKSKIYLATAQCFDAEMRAKIERHKIQRGTGWKTIEAPLDLRTPLSHIDSNDVVLLDCITMWHVLEHVPNLSEYLVRLKSLLKKDGVLIVAVPNFKSYDASHYKNFWAAYDVPRHLSHFSKNAISRLFLKVNMKVKNKLPLFFDSFYVALLSEKYKNGKSNWIRAFFIGLTSNLKAMRSGEYSSLIYIIKNN
jgi:predicted SAM-dependent methyltransferase